jgi:hypothetical protein
MLFSTIQRRPCVTVFRQAQTSRCCSRRDASLLIWHRYGAPDVAAGSGCGYSLFAREGTTTTRIPAAVAAYRWQEELHICTCVLIACQHWYGTTAVQLVAHVFCILLLKPHLHT